jgi:hypothetical protein
MRGGRKASNNKLQVKKSAVRASTFSRTKFLAYRTKPYNTGTPKKISVRNRNIRYAQSSIREKVDARTGQHRLMVNI